MIAALRMYPSEYLRPDYDALWAAVHRRVDGSPERLDHEVDAHASWRRNDLLLGQSCGWPLVTALVGDVTVVGRFDVDVPFAGDGRYRSVFIAAKPWGIDAWRANPGTICAANSRDSLSGWVSLRWAWGGEPDGVVETGSHLESVRAVAEGTAHVASIDAVSFEHMTVAERGLIGRVHVVGHGPVVPTLPLITASALADRVDALRAALVAAAEDAELAPALARLRIRRFIPCGADVYSGLVELMPRG